MSLLRPRFRHHAEQLLYAGSEALLKIRAALGWGIRHLGGPKRVPLDPTDMVVVCLVRNGEPWLPTFLRHYRELGVKHIYFLDNGSSDGTVEMILGQEDVTVFSSDLPFSRYQIAFRRWMLDRFPRGGWGYVCDIDELMIYPFCETLPLPSFLEYLNRHGYTGVVGQVLDMFSDEPLARIQGRSDDELRDVYRYYDISNMRKVRDLKWFHDNDVDSDDIVSYRGGIHGRVFDAPYTNLTKHALFRGDGSVKPFATGAHFAANARMADLTLAIRHYKFIGAFEEHTREGIREGQYYRGSKTYRRYQRTYEGDPQLTLHSQTAREYRDSEKLLEEGFLVASDRFRSWARRHATGGRAGATARGR